MYLSKRAILIAATGVSVVSLAAATLSLTVFRSPAAHAASQPDPYCETHSANCTEPERGQQPVDEYYIGHDEPSTLFYSNRPGSGNSNVYQLTLPTDPKDQPSQNGTGTTWNFQLHPTFWFGMALCDDQSAPNPAGTSVPSRAGPNVPCAADSDANIYTGTQFGQDHFLGQHPGSAFLELQFYPPGWAPLPAAISCDASRWCAAMLIFGFSRNANFPVGDPNRSQNPSCAAQVGTEYANFAFVTKNGRSQAPANPLEATAATVTPDLTKDLLMNSGDSLSVALHDSPDGLVTAIDDLTTGGHGSMTASVANGFGHIKFAPAPSTECSVLREPFHPMYSTSSENTRVPWAAHSYNVAFSDEIGHFEYCATTDGTPTGNCLVAGGRDAGAVPDLDDNYCFNAAQSTRAPISGCQAPNVLDSDFDGPGYGANWPGTNPNAAQDRALHSTPIVFTSPLTHGHNFDRVAFESDMPGLEPSCNFFTGAGCTNPPSGATFYPFFSTIRGGVDNQQGNNQGDFSCAWGEGGAFIPHATNTFGGSSTTAYGSLLFIPYVSGNPANTAGVVIATQNYRNIISSNPCPAQDDGGDHGQ
jgi:hypothetical protein